MPNLLHLPHTTSNLFNCNDKPTELDVESLWTRPCEAAEFLHLDSDSDEDESVWQLPTSMERLHTHSELQKVQDKAWVKEGGHNVGALQAQQGLKPILAYYIKAWAKARARLDEQTGTLLPRVQAEDALDQKEA